MSKPNAVDLSEFAAEGRLSTNRCWFRQLTDDQRAKVDAAHEAGYSNTTIARVVTGWGVKITRSPIQNHYGAGHSCD